MTKTSVQYSSMAERMQRIQNAVKEQLSCARPDFAAISIMLGLFESLHTAKQYAEPSPSCEVDVLHFVDCGAE